MKPIPTWSDGVRPEYRSVVQIAAPLMQQEIDALRKQVAYLTDLAQGRLEQMDADRKQYLDLRDKVKKMDVEGHPV